MDCSSNIIRSIQLVHLLSGCKLGYAFGPGSRLLNGNNFIRGNRVIRCGVHPRSIGRLCRGRRITIRALARTFLPTTARRRVIHRIRRSHVGLRTLANGPIINVTCPYNNGGYSRQITSVVHHHAKIGCTHAVNGAGDFTQRSGLCLFAPGAPGYYFRQIRRLAGHFLRTPTRRPRVFCM